jgi:thiol:disulfide interchange protein
MMRGTTAAIAIACVLASGCSEKPASSLVTFTPYSQDAFDAALGKGRPVVVLGTAPSWCHFCVLLQRGALSDPGVKAALDPFTKLVIDFSDRAPAEKTMLIAQQMTTGLPALVFYDPKGNEVGRLEGNQPAASIIEIAKKATRG